MLAETRARRIKSGEKPLADGTVTGLRLIPAATNGRGNWQLRFISPETSRRRDMGLGAYPEVSIATARDRAFEARKLIAAGLDPISESRKKKKQFASAAQVPTFEEAARKVHDEHKSGWSNGKHVDQWINTLATYVFPVIGGRQVDILKPADFADVLRPIWSTKPETARRVKQRCHSVMKWSCGCQRQSKSEPKGSAKCCHFGVGIISI